jgi:ribonuclease HII
MLGRTWKNIDDDSQKEIKKYLLEKGGKEGEAKGEYEGWRIRFSDSTFTYYITGTLFSTFSKSYDPAVLKAWRQVDSIAGPTYALPSKGFLIGLDETGKGEIAGHTILTAVIFPKEVFEDVNLLVGPADTKKRHKFSYWDEIFKQLDRLRKSGFDFVTEKIPPWHVDRYNLSKMMDVTYQRILSIFFRRANIESCRIVLDDYGVGDTLNRFLKFLENKGAEVIVTTNAEDGFLEAKTASLVSKRTREAVMRAINQNSDFQIDGLSVGSANASDPQTIEWLQKWHNSERKWPWFIKRSFKTIRKIEGKPEKVVKATPPIDEKLLSDEFIEEFNKGNLSVESLSVVCSECGSIHKSVTFATFERNGRKVSELKCPNAKCAELIENAGMTLRYYCGYVVPDSSAIQRSIISNDLAASKFFQDFTVILGPVVRKECDGVRRGKREFEELRGYASMGRIRLESVGKVESLPDDISGTVRDEQIIETCLQYGAILLTADTSMSAFAVGKNVFTIFI